MATLLLRQLQLPHNLHHLLQGYDQNTLYCLLQAY